MYLRLILFIHIIAILLAFLPAKPRFRVLALAENGGHHIAYSKAAKVLLNKLAADSNFAIDYIDNNYKIYKRYIRYPMWHSKLQIRSTSISSDLRSHDNNSLLLILLFLQ